MNGETLSRGQRIPINEYERQVNVLLENEVGSAGLGCFMRRSDQLCLGRSLRYYRRLHAGMHW